MIYLLADFIIDTLGDISRSFSISPLVLGLLILGTDLEESIVSLTAAINGLPYLSLGNLIGNTVIAIGIAFGLPALYLKAEVDQLPRFYYIELFLAGTLVLMSMMLTSYLFLFGFFCIVLFTVHLMYTLKIQREFQLAEGSEGQVEQLPGSRDVEDRSVVSEGRVKSAVKLLVALIIMFLSAEVLVFSAEEIVALTGLNQTFFGLVIMAAVTNVEEFWLIVKAIKKNRTALGVSAQVGKIVWNITLIFGVCSLILMQVTFNPVMMLSSVIFIIALIMLSINLIQNRSSKIAGIGYLLVLLVFLAINSLYAF